MMTLLPAVSPLRQRLARAGAVLSLGAALALGLALPSATLAGTTKAKPTPVFKPPYDAIQSVDAAKKTITVGHVNSTDTTTKTYTASRFCEVEVNGSKADFSGLSVGMKVSVTAGSSETEADRIVASPAPVTPAAPKK